MMFDRSKMTASEWANLSCEDRIDQQMAWRVESFEEAIEAYESGECEDLPINTEALSIGFARKRLMESPVNHIWNTLKSAFHGADLRITYDCSLAEKSSITFKIGATAHGVTSSRPIWWTDCLTPN